MLAGSPNQGQEFAKLQLDSKNSCGASVVHRRLLWRMWMIKAQSYCGTIRNDILGLRIADNS